MRTMITAAVCGAVLVAGGCTDLSVENPNQPDRERALATPSDVESLIAGSFQTWWNGSHEGAPGPALSVAADEHTASWGNFGMQDISWEPRKAIDNDPSYSYAYVFEDPWYESYSAITAVNDGLRAMDAGVELENPERARAFAKFMQGLAHGYVAVLYDQAFIYTETTELDDNGQPLVELQPYDEVAQVAMGFFEESIELSNSKDFTLPDSWIPGLELTNEELAQVAHSYAARFLASMARTEAERDAVDWDAVIAHVDAGVTADFAPLSNDAIDFIDWMKLWGGAFNTWSRVDLRMLGPADISGKYQEWEATAPAERSPFVIETIDERFPEAVDSAETDYLMFHEPHLFRPERGTYHFSNYRWSGFDDYADYTGPMPIVTVREMRLLKAEALYRKDMLPEAAAIVNETRVENGGLPAVTADGDLGDPCIPRLADGNCGDLFEALKYEKRFETYHTGTGIAFFDDRGWGDLVSGTPIQFPIPGQELNVLQLPVYTFGGAGNEGAAP